MDERVAKNFHNESFVDNFVFTCPKLKLSGFKAVNCILPGYSLDTTDVTTGKIIEKLPGLVWRPDNFAMTWLMDESWATYIEILRWMLKIKAADELEIENEISNASVTILDNHQKGVVSFRYDKFFPIGVNSISLESNSGVASPVYGVATFALSDIIMDEINGYEYEDVENLVRP
uniref:Tail tube n=1 Tax=Ochrobactrum phage ORM_20 TaxID=2985243 RepID=A0A9N6X028_9VIRU|nr:tail tube [Ochrobactrum phage ORM_20]